MKMENLIFKQNMYMGKIYRRLIDNDRVLF